MSKRAHFHHGNLRAALVEAGHKALTNKSWDKVSLREVAAAAGVVPSSIYNHFKNKDQLLKALIEDGFKELLRNYENAAMLNATPKERLRHACYSYLEFSIKHPSLFRLVFEGSGAYLPGENESGAHKDSFALFRQLVVACAPTLKKEKQLEATIACWCTIHGFAILHSHNYLFPQEFDLDRSALLVNAAIEIPAHYAN